MKGFVSVRDDWLASGSGAAVDEKGTLFQKILKLSRTKLSDLLR
jgi:hypothetical protein